MGAAVDVVMASFSGPERRQLAASLPAGEAGAGAQPACPACGGALDVRAVARPKEVAYVRRRLWVLCLDCRRSGAVDVRAGGRP